MPGSSLWLIPPARDPFNRTLQTQITSMVPQRFTAKTHDFIPHITLTSNINPHLHEPDAQAWLDSLDFDLEALIARNAAQEADSAAAEKRALEAGNLEPPTAPPPTSSDPEKAALASDDSLPVAESEKPVPAPAAMTTTTTTTTSLPKAVEVNLTELEADDPFFRKLTLKANKPCPGLSALATAARAQGCYSGDVDTARSWEKDEYRPHLSLCYADVPREEAQKKIPGVLQDLVRAKAILKPARDGTVARGGVIVLVPTDKEIEQWKPIASRKVDDVVWRWTMT
ncbi:Phosphoribosylaminoimidazole-succinocarboxamide synthase [Sphaceloma murrayae]|uniref:Phosphoribosylaminoimidazole-succinocarboxamide synthase n=1 Tax=Sphaceloma murrayae TaxID=2082308 RepID=A0A2K1QXU1_9PEZI|nr:Phosphoribosylaminoimidazole-succinocarboxamide synthase [Sphaceloma murrayae]